MGEKSTFSIAEMAALGGVSRRTVRYYVQRGLIPAPTGTGRGCHYTQEHLDALVRVRRLQESGLPLVDIIKGSVDEEKVTVRTPPEAQRSRDSTEPGRSQWIHLKLTEGLELHLRTDLFAVKDPRIARVLEAVRNVLK